MGAWWVRGRQSDDCRLGVCYAAGAQSGILTTAPSNHQTPAKQVSQESDAAPDPAVACYSHQGLSITKNCPQRNEHTLAAALAAALYVPAYPLLALVVTDCPQPSPRSFGRRSRFGPGRKCRSRPR